MPDLSDPPADFAILERAEFLQDRRKRKRNTNRDSFTHLALKQAAFKRASRGGNGSSPNNAVLLTKRGDEAVPAPFLNALAR